MPKTNGVRIRYVVAVLFFCIVDLCLTLSAGASEKIISFHSDIRLDKDSAMTVTETIKVKSANNKIKHGIYRDFPTKYKDNFGNNYVVGFRILGVQKNGVSENYRVSNLSNGKRIYIGNKDILLSPGEYTYTISYITDRQMGFFKDHDELFWNVTGNGWVFDIDNASCRVTIPDELINKLGPKELINKVTLDGYTGPQGSREKNFTSFIYDSGEASFSTSKGLNSYEGLSIIVTFPKGYFKEPTKEDKIRYFFLDNKLTITGAVGLVIIFGYYLTMWSMVGKDPKKGTIIPLFNPPNMMTPASIRFVVKMGFDNKAFAATIINMAVKGFLKINEDGGVYTLLRGSADESVLSHEERDIAHKLLGRSSKIELINTNHKEIKSAITSLKNWLKIKFEKIYFYTNSQYFIVGAALSFLVLFIGGFFESSESAGAAIFMYIWLSGWSFGVIFLLAMSFGAWREFLFGGQNKIAMLGMAVFFSLFSIPFVIFEVFGLYALSSATSPLMVVIFISIVLINAIFYQLLKAPTFEGRNIMDKIEGFKMYLNVAEKDRLNILNPPAQTPELFEKYLPYALALDVEQKWSERFSETLEKANVDGRAYRPVWYNSSNMAAFSTLNFANNLSSSFSNAISSSSTPPGSSSGGSGGGSGGGGGGGGGGGW